MCCSGYPRKPTERQMNRITSRALLTSGSALNYQVDQRNLTKRIIMSENTSPKPSLLTPASLPQVPVLDFKRHSRPQLPTLLTPSRHENRKARVLSVHTEPSWVHHPRAVAKVRAPPEDRSDLVRALSWVDFIRLGRLVQGASESLICMTRDTLTLVIFAPVDESSENSSQLWLSFRHPSLLQARYTIASDVASHVGYDYVRYTLHEVLSVDVPLAELQIQAVASSVSMIQLSSLCIEYVTRCYRYFRP